MSTEPMTTRKLAIKLYDIAFTATDGIIGMEEMLDRERPVIEPGQSARELAKQIDACKKLGWIRLPDSGSPCQTIVFDDNKAAALIEADRVQVQVETLQEAVKRAKKRYFCLYEAEIDDDVSNSWNLRVWQELEAAILSSPSKTPASASTEKDDL